MKETISKKELLLAGIVAIMFTAVTAVYTGMPRSVMANVFFVNIRFMGDAGFAFGTVFFLLFFRNQKELSLRLLLTLMTSLLAIQVIKNMLSGTSMQLYFEPNHPGINDAKNMLSSHTALAVTLAGFFVLHVKNKIANAVFIIAALAVAYSGIYFGSDSVFSLLTGLLPAGIALLITHRIYFYTIKRSFRRRKTHPHGGRHLSPA